MRLTDYSSRTAGETPPARQTGGGGATVKLLTLTLTLLLAGSLIDCRLRVALGIALSDVLAGYSAATSSSHVCPPVWNDSGIATTAIAWD